MVAEGRAAQSAALPRLAESPAMTARARARAAYLLLCLGAVLPASLQLSITEFEVPHVVKVGESAELRCRYELFPEESQIDLFVKWWRTSLDSGDDRTQLYQRMSGRAPFHIHKDIVLEIGDHDTIVLPNVTATDSGTYECEVSNIEEVRRHAQLIVYSEGTGPQLNVSEVEDGPDEDREEDVLIECTARDVAPTPDFILTIDSEEIELTENIEGPDKDGLYDITGNVTVSKTEVDQMEIRCELVYLNPNISHPPYVDSLLYDSTGAITSTELPGNETDTEAPPDSQESDHGCNIKISWFLLLIVGLLTSLRIEN